MGNLAVSAIEASRDTTRAPVCFARTGRVEVAVVVVTHRNADDIEGLVADLRREAGAHRLRVIVADNSSTDGTLAAAQCYPDVVAIATGGNLGYAGGINAAARYVGEAEAVLVLNPDLRVAPGAIGALLARLRADATIGAVVPLLHDDDGTVYESLRREPGLLRATADALSGRRWRTRPAALSEYVREESAYRYAHRIDWATGAALLVRAEAAAVTGEWDERFFLYSEETDYQRRLRDAGWHIWFEPEAVMTHRRGGSGVTADLVALTIVNRVRYIEKHRRRSAAAFRAAVMVGEELRRDPTHARARWALRRRARWQHLPTAQSDPLPLELFPTASVVVPAHDEASTIERTLQPLVPLAQAGRLEIVVVCNGCHDDTAARARAFEGIQVVETPVASKAHALDLGDEHATRWPRVYLDADIVATPRALEPMLRALTDGRALAGRPAFRTVLDGASAPVRAYHRARARMPQASSALWGAGVYALSREGHDRLGRFPPVTADDLYVDRLFSAEEKALPDGEPVEVRPPRDVAAMLRVLARARRGPAEQDVDTGASTLRELARTIRGPLSALDAAAYAGFALIGRWRGERAAQRGRRDWERDDSSRVAGGSAGPGSGDVATDTASVDHVLLTRFNLPTPGPESLVRSREGWLRERIELFERYTVPSVRRQTVQRFRWIVYLDPQSPEWLIERLTPFIRDGVFTPLYREAVSWQDVAADAHTVTGAAGSVLLTTNLDNDDAIADDFVERLQRLAVQRPHAAIFLGRGLIMQGNALYLRRDDENAFCSVAESWQAPGTAWRDWHTLLREHFPVVVDRSSPGWLQVVHGGNVSNRVRGRRVAPTVYRAAFGGLLDSLPVPAPTTVVRDRLVTSPLRDAKEVARRLAKHAVLRVAGKDGLDRIKSRLTERRRPV